MPIKDADPNFAIPLFRALLAEGVSLDQMAGVISEEFRVPKPKRGATIGWFIGTMFVMLRKMKAGYDPPDVMNKLAALGGPKSKQVAAAWYLYLESLK